MITSRSGSSWTPLPGCWIHSKEERPHSAESNSATWMSAILLNVELAGVDQLVVKAQISSRSLLGMPLGPWTSVSRWRMKRPGVPEGGGVAPSRSAGVSAWKPKPEREGAVRRWKVAERPESMRERSRA